MQHLIKFILVAVIITGGSKVYGRFVRSQPHTSAPLLLASETPTTTATLPVVTETPAPAATIAAPTSAADCPPPPWADLVTAERCYTAYPPPLATPIPYCPLNYTLQVWLGCWGYVPAPPYPSPPPGGWPTITPPEQPTPGAPYPAPNP